MIYVENGAMVADTVLDVEHNVYFGSTRFYSGSDGNRDFTSYKSAFPSQDQAAPASVESSPLFVNAAAGDFRLCTGAGVPAPTCSGASPALNRGVDLNDLDSDGSTTDNIPAGAYITNNEVIGRTTTVSSVPPAPPTNFQLIGG